MKQRLLSCLAPAKRTLWGVCCALAAALLPMAAHAQFGALAQASTSFGWLLSGQLAARNLQNIASRNAGNAQSGRLSASVRNWKPGVPPDDPLEVVMGLSDNTGLNQLAATCPPRLRKQCWQQYRAVIAAFDQTMPKTYGVPKNNLATAMTAMLAGGYAAYNNKPLPDGWVKPLYLQMARGLVNVRKVVHTEPREKTALYQTWVGVGMTLMVTQAEYAKHPDPAQQAQLRQTGAEVLRTVLNADPQRVTFSSSGVLVR